MVYKCGSWIGVVLGLTGGILINDQGLYMYGGVGAATPGFGRAVTYSPDNPDSWSCVNFSAAAGPAISMSYPMVNYPFPISSEQKEVEVRIIGLSAMTIYTHIAT